MLDHIDSLCLLRQIGDAQSSTFIVKDLGHRYVLVNRRFADAVGLSPEEIVGKNDLEIGIPERMVLGDPETGYPGFWALDDAAVRGGRARRHRERVVGYRPGHAHEADTVRTPILDAAGTPVALLVQSRDVDDLVGLRRSLAGGDATIAAREGQLSALADVLTTLTDTLVTEHDLLPLLDRIAEALVAHTAVDEAWLWMPDGRGERIVVVAGVGADREAALGRARGPGEGLAGRAWERDGTLYVPDGAGHPATRPFCAPGTEVCAVPLRGEHDVAGVLTVSGPPGGEGPRLEHQVALVEKVADLAAIAIANAQQMAVTRAELARTRALTRLSRLLAATTDPEQDLEAVCRALAEAIGFARMGVELVAGDGTLRPHVAWAVGETGPVRTPARSPSIARESICMWCHETGLAGRIGRDENDPRESERVRTVRRADGLGAVCCAPIARRGRRIGTMAIARALGGPDFDATEAELFGAVVDQLAIALERRALSAALERQAFEDGLTGLANRRRFELDLADALAAPDPDDGVGAVLFLDLDGFKAVNDAHGHAVGDALLARVGERLAGRLGSRDLLARMGGDEFAILLRGSVSAGEAVAVGGRLVEALDEPFEIDGSPVRIGTSVGVAHRPGDGATVDALLRSADAAMYRAKRAGKGRVLRHEGGADGRIARDARDGRDDLAA